MKQKRKTAANNWNIMEANVEEKISYKKRCKNVFRFMKMDDDYPGYISAIIVTICEIFIFLIYAITFIINYRDGSKNDIRVFASMYPGFCVYFSAINFCVRKYGAFKGKKKAGNVMDAVCILPIKKRDVKAVVYKDWILNILTAFVGITTANIGYFYATDKQMAAVVVGIANVFITLSIINLLIIIVMDKRDTIFVKIHTGLFFSFAVYMMTMIIMDFDEKSHLLKIVSNAFPFKILCGYQVIIAWVCIFIAGLYAYNKKIYSR